MRKIILALIIASIWSLNVNAETTARSRVPLPNATPSFTVSCTACDELLKECNAVVGKCDEAIEAQSETIDMLEMQKRVQQRELESSRQELASRRSWYKQPAFVFTAGVLTGFLLSTQVGK